MLQLLFLLTINTKTFKVPLVKPKETDDAYSESKLELHKIGQEIYFACRRVHGKFEPDLSVLRSTAYPLAREKYLEYFSASSSYTMQQLLMYISSYRAHGVKQEHSKYLERVFVKCARGTHSTTCFYNCLSLKDSFKDALTTEYFFTYFNMKFYKHFSKHVAKGIYQEFKNKPATLKIWRKMMKEICPDEAGKKERYFGITVWQKTN